MARNERRLSGSSCPLSVLPADRLSAPHSWPTLCEASPDNISHKHASTYRPASHPVHTVGNALTVPAVVVEVYCFLGKITHKESFVCVAIQDDDARQIILASPQVQSSHFVR